MSFCRRLTRPIAVVVLTMQAVVTTGAAVSLCVNAPHTHGGRPAPDCPMHHQAQTATLPGGADHHHHHSGQHESTPVDGVTLACGCSADLPSFLVASIAVVPGAVAVALPLAVDTEGTRIDVTPIERPSAPLSPPPRQRLS